MHITYGEKQMKPAFKKFKQASIYLLISFFFIQTLAWANPLQSEIRHLTHYIETASCTFIRNGKDHTPEEAVAHILKKYDYFKEKIDTAEEFIEYCASKSTISHKPYLIKCPGMKNVEARIWLTDELIRFRNKSSGQ
jgi:hypothetical protein